MTMSRYHALTLILYPLLLVAFAAAFDHPVYLGALLVAVLLALTYARALGAFFKTMRYAWPWLVLILLLNVLINKNGSTVLWSGPRVPVFGQLRLTGEAFAYSLMMSVRMMVMLAATTLYLVWLSPDRALGLFAKWAGRSAVTTMLTARLFPYLSEQAQTVGDVLQTRGVRFHEGGLKKRLQARKPMLQVLLISSQEGSWHVAEAMEARGFGLGKRTSYTREHWTRRDVPVLLLAFLALVLVALVFMQGLADYAYYPRLQNVRGAETWGSAILLVLLLVLPPLMMKRRRR